ncbi:hypothetical protein [Streptosporangium sp. NPDC051022]|uniref:hypothetical protein n=1 Tax=Streptosporangium sp. NPDC051022 TaxID=3155752 RepID=UPI00344770E7
MAGSGVDDGLSLRARKVRRRGRRAAAVSAVALVIVCVVTAVVVAEFLRSLLLGSPRLPLTLIWQRTGLACMTDPTGEWAARAGKEGVLRDTPPGAVKISESVTRACENERNIGSVGLRYRFSGSTGTTMAYYRKRALADGWRLLREDGDSAPPAKEQLCLSKNLGEFTGYLDLTVLRLKDYATEEERRTGDYDLRISFSPGGFGWCG